MTKDGKKDDIKYVIKALNEIKTLTIPVDIINMSLGQYPQSSELNAILTELSARKIIVAAAGASSFLFVYLRIQTFFNFEKLSNYVCVVLQTFRVFSYNIDIRGKEPALKKTTYSGLRSTQHSLLKLLRILCSAYSCCMQKPVASFQRSH